VSRADALDALACAEDHGCNFVDTAAVYGDSEARLGEFLEGRRDRWVVASKFSGQPDGLPAVLESQLTRLRTDRIDVYQLHWAPRGVEEQLYDDLARLRDAGKIRFIGVSLRSAGDLEHVLSGGLVDVVQLPVSLLDPEPLTSHALMVRQRGVGVIARSALKGGFLTGKYDGHARFTSLGDQRAAWKDDDVRRLAAQAEAFAFLGNDAGARLAGAIAYPLSFDTVSTVILGCRNRTQAQQNFAREIRALPPGVLSTIAKTQRHIGVGPRSRVGLAGGRFPDACSSLPVRGVALSSVDGQSRSRTRSVAGNSGWLTLDAIFGVVGSLVLSVFVARSLGPDVLGVYNFASWALTAGVVVVTNGVTYGLQMFTAERFGQGDIEGAKAIVRQGLRWQLALSAVLLLAGLAVTAALAPPPLQVALTLAVMSVVPAILVSVPAAGLGAAQAFAANALSSIAAIIVNLLVTVGTLAAGWGLTGVTSALLMSRLVDAGGRYLAWHRVLRRTVPPTHSISRELDVPRLKRFAAASSLLLLVDMVVWDRSEFVVLSRVSALRELAYYSLSFNIVQQALVLPRLFTKALAATLLIERGADPEAVPRLTGEGMRYVFLMAAPLTLGLASLSKALMPMVYGAAYAPAVPVLAVVAGLAVIRGALAPVQTLFYIAEKQTFLIRFSLVLGAVNIALDLWLIPLGGALGAAWANGVTQALAAVGLTVFAARQLQLPVPVAALGRIALACVPMVGLVSGITLVLPSVPAIALGVPAGAITYFLGLRALRVVRPLDRDRLATLERLLPSMVRRPYLRTLNWLSESAV